MSQVGEGTATSICPSRIRSGKERIGIGYLFTGDPAEAVPAFEREPLAVLKFIGLTMAHHTSGDSAASDRVLDELIGTYERDAAYNIAYVMACRGETDKAFEWLAKAVEFGDPGMSEIAIEPLFDNIKSDARWLPFLTSVGKSPEQLDAVDFEVTLPTQKSIPKMIL